MEAVLRNNHASQPVSHMISSMIKMNCKLRQKNTRGWHKNKNLKVTVLRSYGFLKQETESIAIFLDKIRNIIYYYQNMSLGEKRTIYPGGMPMLQATYVSGQRGL